VVHKSVLKPLHITMEYLFLGARPTFLVWIFHSLRKL